MEDQRMNMEHYYEKVYQEIDGIPLCRALEERHVRSAITYQPDEDDVFIATYPKCGTMWMQNIVYGIITQGNKDLPTLEERRKNLPFIEFVGADVVSSAARPRIIKTHLPLQLLALSAKAKYIYVARNPYDVCVSFYYQKNIVPFYCFENGTFDEFFDMFVHGKVANGDYAAHLLSWYEHRGDSNVLFVTYEELKRDIRGCILTIADFLGKEQHGDRLRDDPLAVENVVELSSFEKSKRFYTGDEKITDKSVPTAVHHHKSAMSREIPQYEEAVKRVTENHTRKGIVGDWKNHFSPQQVARMREYISLKTGGSDVMNLWRDINIP